MNNIEKRVEQLSEQLDGMIKLFVQQRKEIRGMSKELANIKMYLKQHPNLTDQERKVTALEQKVEQIEQEVEDAAPVELKEKESLSETPQSLNPSVSPPLHPSTPQSPQPSAGPPKKKKSQVFDFSDNLEAFIGGNLLNKIGIIAIILGVAIGAKFAIDNNYISPLVRIILGYLTGLGLLGVAIRLKPKYESFSAVLLGGAMTIMYFITFAAHSFYNLFPSIVAFLLMVFFTICTVIAALQYKQQVIAVLGLVGAYAVPFLVGSDSDSALLLFAYMGVVNIGIAITAFYQNWKLLYYLAFAFTWGIFAMWMDDKNLEEGIWMGLGFATLFFLTFYACALAYKVINKEKLVWQDVVLILLNSFIYYGMGMQLLNSGDLEEFQGLFTLFNAFIHFAATVFIYQSKLGDKSLFFFVSGLVITFLTIAVPVQLDGSWVLLIWVLEALLLFGIGRFRQVKVYELLAFPVLFLSFLSLVYNWGENYIPYIDSLSDTENLRVIFNTYFLQTVLVLVGYAALNYMNLMKPYRTLAAEKGFSLALPDILLPLVLVVTAYFGGLLELICYNVGIYQDSVIIGLTESGSTRRDYNDAVGYMGMAYILIYNLIFQAGITTVIAKKLKYYIPGNIIIAFNLITIALVVLSIPELIFEPLAEYYEIYKKGGTHAPSIWYIGIRYIIYLFIGLVFFLTLYLGKQSFMNKGKWPVILEFYGFFLLFVIINQEFIHWDIQRFGLTILWGAFALFLLSLGFWASKKYFRISGIILFGLTVCKLVFYDMANMPTITKTLTFIGLGVLLLIGSFLYNKFADQLVEEDKKNIHEQV